MNQHAHFRFFLFTLTSKNFMFKNKIMSRTKTIRTWFGYARQNPDLTLVIASMFLFIMGLKPFHLGLWFQSESVTLVLFLLASLTAAIFLFHKSSVSRFIEAAHHPVVKLLLAMVALSTLQSVFTEFPMRSFFGPPETGEGIFSWLALAMLTAGAYNVWHRPSARRPVIIAALVASLLSIALQRISSTINWQPAKWPDFASFIAIFVMIILMAAPDRLTRTNMVFATILGTLIAILSNSLSLWLILLSIPALIYGLGHMRRRMNNDQRFMRRARYIFIAMALLPLLITVFAFQVGLMREINAGIGNLFSIHNIKDFPFEQGSLGTRVMFNHVGLDAALDQPSHILTGFGWGSFSDILFRYVLTDGIYLYNAAAHWEPNWYMVAGSAFNPHNSFMAIFLATGIGGLILFCLIPVVIIWQLPDERLLIIGPLWAAVFLLSGVWFMLPIALPFMAIALAASMRPPARMPLSAIAASSRRYLNIFGAVVVALFTVAMGVQYDTARSAERLIQAIQTRLPEMGDSESLHDHGRGNTHLWWIALNLSQYINSKLENHAGSKAADVAWFNEMLGIVGAVVADGTAGDRLRGHYAFMHNDLIALYPTPLWNDLQNDRLPHWKDEVLKAVRDIPTRGDLALVYYSFFMERIKPTETQQTNDALADRILQLTEPVLKNNPRDIPALWFSGLVLIRHQETTQVGFQRLYTVIDNHGEHFVPITDVLRNSINATRAH